MPIVRTAILTLQLALHWLLVLAILAGIGLLAMRWLARLLRSDEPATVSAANLFMHVGLGFGVLVLFLQIWHPFAPVTPLTAGITLVPALVGLTLERGALIAWGRRCGNRRGLWVGGLTALVTLWLANLAIAPCCSYDTAMYHLPTMRWATEYPTVPGIGNLFTQLAFNGSSLLYAAWLDTLPVSVPPWHLAHGPLIVPIGAGVIAAGAAIWAGQGSRQDWFRLATLMFLTMLALTEGMSSLNPDLATSALLIAAAWQVARALDPVEKDDAALHGTIAAVLLVAAATVKLSVAVFAAVGVLALLRGGSIDRGRIRRYRVVLLTAAAALAGSWSARSIVQSGYPAFPSSAFGTPVAWRVPEPLADGAVAWFHHRSRQYWTPTDETRDLADADRRLWWVRPWFVQTFLRPRPIQRSVQGTPWEAAVPLLLALLGLAAAVHRRRSGWRPTPWEAVLAVASTAGLAFWLLVAPAPRYGWGALGITGALGTLCLLPPEPRRRKLAMSAVLTLGLSPLWGSVALAGVQGGSMVSAFRAVAMNGAPEDGGFPRLREQSVETRTLAGGLELLVPLGDENACWDAGLLCTPQPEPGLRLLRPGSLAEGFRIEGDWQAERWPHPQAQGFRDAWIERLESR